MMRYLIIMLLLTFQLRASDQHSCVEYRENLVTLQKYRSNLKIDNKTKLRDLELEHNKAMSELLIYRGLEMLKNNYLKNLKKVYSNDQIRKEIIKQIDDIAAINSVEDLLTNIENGNEEINNALKGPPEKFVKIFISVCKKRRSDECNISALNKNRDTITTIVDLWQKGNHNNKTAIQFRNELRNGISNRATRAKEMQDLQQQLTQNPSPEELKRYKNKISSKILKDLEKKYGNEFKEKFKTLKKKNKLYGKKGESNLPLTWKNFKNELKKHLALCESTQDFKQCIQDGSLEEFGAGIIENRGRKVIDIQKKIVAAKEEEDYKNLSQMINLIAKRAKKYCSEGNGQIREQFYQGPCYFRTNNLPKPMSSNSSMFALVDSAGKILAELDYSVNKNQKNDRDKEKNRLIKLCNKAFSKKEGRRVKLKYIVPNICDGLVKFRKSKERVAREAKEAKFRKSIFKGEIITAMGFRGQKYYTKKTSFGTAFGQSATKSWLDPNLLQVGINTLYADDIAEDKQNEGIRRKQLLHEQAQFENFYFNNFATYFQFLGDRPFVPNYGYSSGVNNFFYDFSSIGPNYNAYDFDDITS